MILNEEDAQVTPLLGEVKSRRFDYIGFLKLFSIFWLTFTALSPYLYLIFALSVFDFKFSSGLFRILVDLISVPILPLAFIFLFKREVPKADRFRSLVALNAKSFFSLGMASFYIVLLIAVILANGNFFVVIMEFIFSLIYFPFMSRLLRFGLKFSQEIVNKE